MGGKNKRGTHTRMMWVWENEKIGMIPTVRGCGYEGRKSICNTHLEERVVGMRARK